METMRSLKRSFKEAAREVIETSYINKVNKMGWCIHEKQKILNKSQMYTYIKSNDLNEEKLMRDLWELQYERFRNEDSELIQSFVNQFMTENYMVYQDDGEEKKKSGSGCFEVIAISIKNDINKQIRGITKESYKWIIRQRYDNGRKKGYEKDVSTEERFRRSIKRFKDYNTQTELYKKKDLQLENNDKGMENVVEKMRRLEEEIKNLQEKNKLLLNGNKTDSNDCVNSDKGLKNKKEVTKSNANNNKKIGKRIGLVTDVHTLDLNLQAIPAISINNVNLNIDSVGPSACLNFGSNVIPNENTRVIENEEEIFEKNKRDDIIGKEKKNNNDAASLQVNSENKNKVRGYDEECDNKERKTDAASTNYWECEHPSFNEISKPEYATNGNELEDVFCNTCKIQFVHKYSDDIKKRKDQWKPGFGENLVHSCTKCYQCNVAYCHKCWIRKICKTSSRKKRKRGDKVEK